MCVGGGGEITHASLSPYWMHNLLVYNCMIPGDPRALSCGTLQQQLTDFLSAGPWNNGCVCVLGRGVACQGNCEVVLNSPCAIDRYLKSDSPSLSHSHTQRPSPPPPPLLPWSLFQHRKTDPVWGPSLTGCFNVDTVKIYIYKMRIYLVCKVVSFVLMAINFVFHCSGGGGGGMLVKSGKWAFSKGSKEFI